MMNKLYKQFNINVQELLSWKKENVLYYPQFSNAGHDEMMVGSGHWTVSFNPKKKKEKNQ